MPGDIVELKTGDTIPADLRLFTAMNLYCLEKSLTGESDPVEKTTKGDLMKSGTQILATEETDVQMMERTNMAYATTTVTKGHGKGIVVFTGMDTEVGKIAASTAGKAPKNDLTLGEDNKIGWMQYVKYWSKRGLLATGDFLGLTKGTPLQRKLSKLAYLLFGCAILLAMVVFAVNKFKISNEVAIYAISTGIAIIPESLIA